MDVQCSAHADCTVNPFGDGVRSLKIVCSPTNNTSLNITQIRLYYGTADRPAGDLFAVWPASAEAEKRNAANITRDGAAAFETFVPARLDRVNFQFYATISATDAAGTSMQAAQAQSSAVTLAMEEGSLLCTLSYFVL
jgi:hypothetical protein